MSKEKDDLIARSKQYWNPGKTSEWQRMGVDVRRVVHGMLNVPPDDLIFQQMLFSKIVPNCRKLGLLDAGDGWLRQKFTEIGVIQYENHADTEEEYETFAAVTAA